MIVSLSETFLTDFINIRRELFLGTNKTEKLVCSEVFWSKQLDKKEIQINGNYYDVKSISYIQKKVILNVVQDNFELTFKIITENLNKKHKLLKTKKNIDILPSQEFQFSLKSSKIISKNNFNSPISLENKILILLFQPPIFI